MGRFFFAIMVSVLCAFSSNSLLSEPLKISKNKQHLITQVQSWVAEERKIEKASVEVGALDRRFLVPSCPSDFEVSFPFANNYQSVRVDCAETAWKAFLRVKIHSLGQSFVYRRDFPADHPLQRDDLKVKKLKTRTQGLITKLEQIDLKSLRKSVRAGELVKLQHLTESVRVFRLTRDILIGESLSRESLEEVLQPVNKTLMTQRFPERLLEHGIAAKDLSKGQILQKRDIKERHLALIAQITLTRGQKLSSENARMESYFGHLPSDAIISESSLEQLEVTRTIQAGSVLRMSDVKEADLIKRDDIVTLTVGRGALVITVAMKAVGNGKLGQQIQLLNPESGEIITAEVSGPRQAVAL
jgi:flagella basal body P-ring formation protein FlgA